MKKHLFFLLFVLPSPILLLGQNLDVEGKAVITDMDKINSADSLVVHLAGGFLGVRDVSSLPLKGSIADMDNDTKIQVEKNADEDMIRFDLGGVEKWTMLGNRLESKNTGLSVFIGAGSGMLDDLSDNLNVAVGDSSFFSNTSGQFNSAFGYKALYSNTIGEWNVGIGMRALFENTEGVDNVAVGGLALTGNTTGINNTGVGSNSLELNTTGGHNTAIGFLSLRRNVTGDFNVAVGASSLRFNNVGEYNTAIGFQTMVLNTIGIRNTAVGSNALHSNVEGGNNTAIGFQTLFSNSTGTNNSGIGNYSLLNNTLGSTNTAIGVSSLFENIEGHGNTAIGYEALAEMTSDLYNTAIGYESGRNATGNRNVFLGYQAGYSSIGDDKLFIDNNGSVNPLIWGDFENDSLKVYGTFNINNAFSFPTIDGTIGQQLISDGSGELTWDDAIPSKLIDDDLNTQIQVEKTANDDIIRFDLAGVEKWFMAGSRLEPANSGLSVFIGEDAGLNDDLSNNDNVNIGYKAGESNVAGNLNTAVGSRAMQDINGGDRNVAFGYAALSNATNGSGNTAIGAFSLDGASTGNNNTAVGRAAGTINTGSNNVFVGEESGFENSTGSNNVFVGENSGFDNITGSNNVFLGNSAGEHELGSDKLYIQNNDSFIPLIWGDFTNDFVGINRVATTNTLEVGGDASKAVTGSWLANSDSRLKKNISYLNSEAILHKVLEMKAVNYEWNDDKTGMQRPEGIMYGFIAQDLEKVWPTKVKEDNQGYLQTAYGDYDPMFVEAIKALYAQNQELMLMIEVQSIKNESLKAEVVELSTMKEQLIAMSKRIEMIEELKALKSNE